MASVLSDADKSTGCRLWCQPDNWVLKPASPVVDQATGYCAKVGSMYAVLTDGERWVFFRAIRPDGLAPKTGKAFVFPSLTSVLEDFPTFYELLAPDALRDQLHIARINNLEGGHIRAAEPRYFVDDPEDARLLPRGEISRDIVDLFKRFFAAMNDADDDEMRRTCFVDTPESRDAETSLTKITAHLTSAIKTIEAQHGRELQAEIQKVIDSKLAEICLIVGATGSGKSTFVERFFEDVLPRDVRDACVVTRIDVSKYPGGEISIEHWLAERLRDQYERSLFRDDDPTYEDFMGMFFDTYKRWSSAIYRDLYRTNKDEFKIKFGGYVEERRETRPHEYLVGLMQHSVFGRTRLPCIIFDNVDYFSPEVQAEIIRYASILKTSCASFILVSAKGHAHLDFALDDEVYLEEMARVSGFRFSQTRSEIESAIRAGDVAQVNSMFSKTILVDDAAKLRVPNAEGYSILTKLRNEFAARWKWRPPRPEAARAR